MKGINRLASFIKPDHRYVYLGTSVIAALGSENFPRIRLGVGEPPHPDYDTADWVLGAPKGKDAELFAQAAERAADAAECYISEGPERAMNKYNRKAQ